MCEPYDPNCKIALKRHGYVFSDGEDGATDSSDCDNYDEPAAHLKPPPLIIPADRIVLIKPPKVHPNPPALSKNHNGRKKVYKPKQKIKPVSTQNFYKVLETSSSENSDEDREHDRSSFSENLKSEANVEETCLYDTNTNFAFRRNNLYGNTGEPRKSLELVTDCIHSDFLVNSRDVQNSSKDGDLSAGRKVKPKKENKKRDKLHKRMDYSLKKTAPTSDSSKDMFTRNNFILDPNDDICLVWCLYPSENQFLANFINPDRTSWDNISRNNVYRSDMLLQQEYEIIIGPIKEKNEETGNINKKLSTSFAISRLLKGVNYMEFLNVAAVVIGAYLWHKFNK